MDELHLNELKLIENLVEMKQVRAEARAMLLEELKEGNLNGWTSERRKDVNLLIETIKMLNEEIEDSNRVIYEE